MESIATAIDILFNGQAGGPHRETGFVLLVFPFNDARGRCNYISNSADRADVVTLLREQIKRFEADANAVPENSSN